VEKVENKGEMVVTSWNRVVEILFDLRSAWGIHRVAVAELGKVGIEGLPISIQKHVTHVFNKAQFNKALPILIDYWAVRGGLEFLKSGISLEVEESEAEESEVEEPEVEVEEVKIKQEKKGKRR